MGSGGRSPNGQQIKRIMDAFVEAFKVPDIEKMLDIYMNARLDTVTGSTNVRDVAFELIMWAKRQGRVGELLRAASDYAVEYGSSNDLLAPVVTEAAGWGLSDAAKLGPAGGGAAVPVAQPTQPAAPAQPAPQDEGPQLTATLALKMAYVPTAVIHLLDPGQYPVVQVEVTNTANRPRRLRVISSVEDYSSTWSDTVELGAAGSAAATATVLQQPVFKRDALRTINERLLAVIRTQVEDLDAQRTQLDITKRIWMLPINSAPVRVKDEVTGDPRDMLPYLGAFVTNNEASIQGYLPTVAGNHPKKQLAGYYAADSVGDSVRSQVRALTAALKPKLSYATALVESVADSAYQRVRLPRECLAVGQANCLEGTLLYCSLLEAMGLQSAVVWAREHAVAAWIENPAKPTEWSFLDPTKVANGTFETAMEWGATIYEDNKDKGPDAFRILPVRDLRAQGITPLE